jgi:uncharacterized protein YjiK
VAVYLIFFQPEKTEWIMPKELNEISGISFTDEHTLACVQDEKGIIFLYDLDKSKITERINFAEKGDYEGITIKDKTAYVITGDGILYEVRNFLTDPKVEIFYLDLRKNEESEAICYDPVTDRLLLAFKNSKKENVNPGIFAFDLTAGKLNNEAVVRVNLATANVKKKDLDNNKKLWEPADIAIDVNNQRIYVIDAINRHLMEFSRSGELTGMSHTDPKRMDHPEGIAVSPDGNLFICNDASREGKGKIMKFMMQH